MRRDLAPATSSNLSPHHFQAQRIRRLVAVSATLERKVAQAMNAPAPTELLRLADKLDRRFKMGQPTLRNEEVPVIIAALRQAASVGAEVAGEAVDLPLTWECYAQALQLMKDRSGKPDTETGAKIEQLKECAKELRAALTSPSRSEGVSKGEVLNDDARHVKSALETLCDPLLIKVDGHLVGTARAMAIIDGMREIAQRALLRLPDALAGIAAQKASGCGDPSCKDPNCEYGTEDDALRAEVRSLRIDNARLRDEAFLRSAQASGQCRHPHLGLATTRELLAEISARIEIHAVGGLDYRTVGGEEIAARGLLVPSADGGTAA